MSQKEISDYSVTTSGSHANAIYLLQQKENQLLQRVDGIGMGSPNVCIVDNFFLVHLETLIFKDQMPCHPKLYVRYINYVFAVFDDLNACLSLLNILNNQYDNIKFTIKKSTTTLQFINVEIKITKNTV